MPSAYRHDLPRLKADILEGVAAGLSVRDICRRDWAPCWETVRKWARADSAFGAALAAASRRARWRAARAYDEDKAERFLAGVRAGVPVKALYGRPGMPTAKTVAHWRATQPPFAEALWAVWGPGGPGGANARRAKLAAAGRARRKDFDPAVADRLIVALNRLGRDHTLEEVLASDPGFPSRPVLTRWRREEPWFDRTLRMMFAGWRGARARTRRVPKALAGAIGMHIALGGSFASWSRKTGVSRTTLRRWHRADAAFAAEVAKACDFRDWMLQDQALDLALHGGHRTVRELNRAVGPMRRRIARLRHRPGAAHRKPGERGEAETGGFAGDAGDGP